MKAHIGVDADSALVHTITTTPANEHDITQAHALVHGEEEVVTFSKVAPIIWTAYR